MDSGGMSDYDNRMFDAQNLSNQTREVARLKNLLTWYVDHVILCEGTDFLNQDFDAGSSRINIKEIKAIVAEISPNGN